MSGLAHAGKEAEDDYQRPRDAVHRLTGELSAGGVKPYMRMGGEYGVFHRQ